MDDGRPNRIMGVPPPRYTRDAAKLTDEELTDTNTNTRYNMAGRIWN